jgi:hypothetical protein
MQSQMAPHQADKAAGDYKAPDLRGIQRHYWDNRSRK